MSFKRTKFTSSAYYCLCYLTLLVCLVRTRLVNSWPISSAGHWDQDQIGALEHYLEELMDSIDHSVDPCDDFYGHVCGKWNRTLHMIRSNDILNHMNDQSVQTIMAAFEEHEASVKPSAVQLVVDLFRMCTSATSQNRYDFVSYSEFLLFPCDGEGKRCRKHWMDRYVKWWLMGTAPILTITVEADRNETDGTLVNRFQLKAAKYDYLSSTAERVERMVQLIVKYPKFHYLNESIQSMARVEKLLAKHSSQGKPTCDLSLTHRLNLAELKHQTGNLVDWTLLLNKIALQSEAQLNLTEQDMVLVPDVHFMFGLAKAISRSSELVWKHYMVWRFAYATLGQEESQPRVHNRMLQWSMDPKLNCIESLKQDEHSLVISRLYLNQISKGNLERLADIKRKASELAQDLKQAFRQMLLSEVHWLDNRARQYALNKLDSMLQLVAYPEVALNDTALDAMYGVNQQDSIQLDQYWNNYYLAKTAVNTRRNTNLLQHFKDHPEVILSWKVNPASFGNGKYIRAQNAILIPMAMLQPPLFHPNYPAVINFAVTGFFVGHEMTHGFDREGCKYDMYGNEKVINWCSDQTSDAFGQMASCFEQQYSQLVEPRTGHQINGRRTLSENIADNGGLREAYFAFQNHLSHSTERPEDRYFDRLYYSHEQLFFVNYAKVWCSKPRELSDLSRCIKRYYHSLPVHRVNVPLSNMVQFADAFKCSLDSRMNRRDRCVLW